MPGRSSTWCVTRVPLDPFRIAQDATRWIMNRVECERFEDDDFPATSFDARRFLFAPALGMYGIQRIDMVKDCMIVAGAGVGGGSLVYANTLYEPLPPFFADRQWAHITDWQAELARERLGAQVELLQQCKAAPEVASRPWS